MKRFHKMVAAVMAVATLATSMVPLSADALYFNGQSKFAYDLSVDDANWDDMVRVTFYTTYNPGVTSFSVALKYDTSKLEYVESYRDSDYESAGTFGTSNDKTKGMGTYKANIDKDALDFLADMAGGDARNALNAIELGILTTPRSEDGLIHITLDVASQCIQKRVVRYDKNGDNHYDIISAFIKSMRGSDPDAAVYYLAKMLYAGEDVKFIARRIMILASEDIGNADPQALCVAVAAAQAVERVGMPESQIILSQAVTYMACAPKSNSAVNAIFAAMDSVKRTKTTVPPHLQDAHYGGHEKLGHGIGYKYAHDYPNHYVHQQYLPTEIQGEHFYELSEMGYEKTLKEYQNKIKSQS